MLILAPLPGAATTIQWEPLMDGLAVSVWTPGSSCPAVPDLLAIDADPERVRFSIHYYADEKLARPIPIEQWQKLTGHPVLFNAGLFRENFSYLGLLYKDGRALGNRRHGTWQGLFAAEAVHEGLRKARVLDLAMESFDEDRPPYREAAQSLMLLDRRRMIRVRQSGKEAYQTIVAETEAGHIVIMKSREVTSLYDLARCLRDAMPWVRQAMAMDGGASSDVLVVESLWRDDRRTAGRVSWKALFGGKTSTHIPLPTVIGVSPR
ncbi:MAG: phosphodiester glycosidase family protein [Nitrospira sp.]|nr:phosphodiester glycosidase family protein [Nitrospira sp.]